MSEEDRNALRQALAELAHGMDQRNTFVRALCGVILPTAG